MDYVGDMEYKDYDDVDFEAYLNAIKDMSVLFGLPMSYIEDEFVLQGEIDPEFYYLLHNDDDHDFDLSAFDAL